MGWNKNAPSKENLCKLVLKLSKNLVNIGGLFQDIILQCNTLNTDLRRKKKAF